MNWFIGLWTIAWKEAFGVAGVAALFAAWWFIPATFPKLKQMMLITAIAMATLMVSYNWGIRDANKRWQERARAAVQQEITDGNEARTEADAHVDRLGPGGMSDDRFNRDTWGQPEADR